MQDACNFMHWTPAMLRSDIDHTSAPARRTTLAKIIREQTVGRQTELVAMLRKHGHAATQSSVSRDLRELGVAKMGDRYLKTLEANEEVVARNVTENLYNRHIVPIFLGK